VKRQKLASTFLVILVFVSFFCFLNVPLVHAALPSQTVKYYSSTADGYVTNNTLPHATATAGVAGTVTNTTTTSYVGQMMDNTSFSTVYPNAVGDYSNWTKSSGTYNYQMVDEPDEHDSDTTYVSASAASDIDLYNVGTPTGSPDAWAQITVTIVSRKVTTNSFIRICIKTDGTKYNGSWQAVSSTSYGYKTETWALNPKFGYSWNITSLTALQIGIEINTTTPFVRCTQVYVDMYYCTPTIYRAAEYFDCSSIPDGATITAASMYLYMSTDKSETDFNVLVLNSTSGTYPHNPLQTTDYKKTNYLATEGGLWETVDYGGVGYVEIPFGASGLVMISKTAVSKFFIISSRDLAGTVGGFQSTNDEEYMIFGTAESANILLRPYLQVTWSYTETFKPLIMGANITRFNESCGFHLYVELAPEAVGYIFSCNITGTDMVNNTYATATGGILWMNATKQLNTSSGNSVGFQWFVNRTDNLWNTTEIKYFTVTQPTSILASTLSTSWDNLNFPRQRKMMYKKSLYWAFYKNNDTEDARNDIVYKTSPDGVTWSPETVVIEDACVGSGAEVFTTYTDELDGDYIHYVYDNTTITAEFSAIYYCRGRFSADGTITWGTTQLVWTNPLPTWYARYVELIVDSAGYPVIQFLCRNLTTTYGPPILLRSSTNNGTWVNDTAAGFPYNLTSTLADWNNGLVALTNRKFYSYWADMNKTIYGKLWNGTALGSEENCTNYRLSMCYRFASEAEGDNVHLAYLTFDESWVRYKLRTYGVGWGTESNITTAGTDENSAPVLSVVNANRVFIAWIDPSGTVQYVFFNTSSAQFLMQNVLYDKTTSEYSSSSIYAHPVCYAKSWGQRVGVMWLIANDTDSTATILHSYVEVPIAYSYTNQTLTYTQQHPVVYASSNYWLLYSDGLNLSYISSNTGYFWSGAIALESCTNATYFAHCYNGTKIFIALVSEGSNNTLFFRMATSSTTGILGLSTKVTAVASVTNMTYYEPNIGYGSDGNVWISYKVFNETSQAYLYTNITKNNALDGTWSTVSGFPISLVSENAFATFESLTSGYVYITYSNGSGLKGRLWNGTLQAEETLSTDIDEQHCFSTTSINSTIYLACKNSTNDILFKTYSSSWGTTSYVNTGDDSSIVSLCTNETSVDTFCFWTVNNGIYYDRLFTGWSRRLLLVNLSANGMDSLALPHSLSTMKTVANNTWLGVSYLSKMCCDYLIRFDMYFYVPSNIIRFYTSILFGFIVDAYPRYNWYRYHNMPMSFSVNQQKTVDVSRSSSFSWTFLLDTFRNWALSGVGTIPISFSFEKARAVSWVQESSTPLTFITTSIYTRLASILNFFGNILFQFVEGSQKTLALTLQSTVPLSFTISTLYSQIVLGFLYFFGSVPINFAVNLQRIISFNVQGAVPLTFIMNSAYSRLVILLNLFGTVVFNFAMNMAKTFSFNIFSAETLAFTVASLSTIIGMPVLLYLFGIIPLAFTVASFTPFSIPTAADIALALGAVAFVLAVTAIAFTVIRRRRED